MIQGEWGRQACGGFDRRAQRGGLETRGKNLVCSNHGLIEISILIVIVHPKTTLIVLLGFQGCGTRICMNPPTLPTGVNKNNIQSCIAVICSQHYVIAYKLHLWCNGYHDCLKCSKICASLLSTQPLTHHNLRLLMQHIVRDNSVRI